MKALSTLAVFVALLAGSTLAADELPSWTDEIEGMFRSLPAGAADSGNVADPDASGGRAVEVSKKTGAITSWHNYRTLPPGEYLARFRLKVSDNTSSQVVFDVHAENTAGSLQLRANQFAAPGKYQDFDVPFTITRPTLVSTPVTGIAGNVASWADRVTISTTRRYGDRHQLRLLGYKSPKFELPASASGVLLVQGLYHELWHAGDALTPLGPLTACVVVSGSIEPALRGFPESLEALGHYRLVVLADVPAGALTVQQRAMVEAFVQGGGALLVLGGPYAFGLGDYQQSEIIADLLPVVVDRHYDLIKNRPADRWEIAHAWQLAGAPGAKSAPRVVYRHRLRTKDATEVLASAGGEPLIVAGRAGAGRVVVVLATPLGEVAESETAWWNWKGWPPLLTRIALWMVEKAE